MLTRPLCTALALWPSQLACLLLATALVVGATAPARATDQLRVIDSYPRDPRIFTQGLALSEDRLYHSGGLRGHSAVTLSRLGDTRPQRRFRLADRYFAEGLAAVDGEIYLLTWQAGTLFVLDADSLTLKRQLRYRGEGWGLAFDGRQLLVSDGSATITRRDPATLHALGHFEVRDDNGPVRQLNELEWARGTLFANVWQSTRLIAIDANSGSVAAEWDLGPLIPPVRHYGVNGVANGIAYDADSGHFLVTGKGWPVIYRVELSSERLDLRPGRS